MFDEVLPAGTDTLRADNVRLRAYLDLSQAIMLACDVEGRVTLVNHMGHTVLGYGEGELDGADWCQTCVPSGERQAVHDLFRAWIEGRNQMPDHFRNHVVRKDGELRLIEWWNVGIYGTDGTVTCILSSGEDVTDQDKVERALRESEFFFRESQRVAAIGSYKVDFVAERWESSEMLDELLGIQAGYDRSIKGWLELVHPDDRSKMDAYLRDHVITQGQSFVTEYRIIRPCDGAVRWVSGRGRVARNGEGLVVSMIGTIQDVTDLKRVEDGLREREELLRLSLQGADLAAWDWDIPSGRITVNGRWFEMLGFRPGEIEASFTDLNDRVHPDDLAAMRQTLEAHVAGSAPVYESEHRMRHKDLGWIWVLDRGRVIRHDEEGRPLRMCGTHLDITARKREEADRIVLRDQLQQAQKMESLGALAGGIAHDMNNVLGAIMALASAFVETDTVDNRARKAFNTILKAADRGGKMVKSLLQFARKAPQEEQVLDLNGLIRDNFQLLERTTLARIELRTDLAVDLYPVLGNSADLANAIMNLCVNALDAMPDGGKLGIQTRNAEPGWVEVELADSGSGMAKDVLDQAITPFFTTKPQGQGTGMGLAMAYAIMKAHRGTLDIQSELGRGTRVRLRFPSHLVLAPPVVAALAPSDPGQAKGMDVLLVDDDDLIRGSLLVILGTMGHRTTAVVSGEDALVVLAEGLRPDVVILDMNMPGLGGATTLARLRQTHPTLPVLVSTGRADQGVLDMVAAHPYTWLLEKPFQMVDLRHTIDAIVAR